METNRVLVARLKRRRDELREAKANVEEQLRLVEEMLAGAEAQRILQELEEEPIAADQQGEVGDIGLEEIEPLIGSVDLTDVPVWRAAVRILEKVGRPLSTETMVRAIQLSGREFGGSNPGRSLAAHVSQHKDVINQEDGWIYLVEWGRPNLK